MLNTLADRTLNEQSQVSILPSITIQLVKIVSQILATAGDDQEDEVRKAKDLINWIMNVTKRPPEPRLLLGQRFVGQLEKFQATAKYDLFKSRFVTGEMVVVKVLRANLSGKDDADMISKFQKRAEIWYNLHSDHTLQFYGIGKMDINNQPHIYSVSPYMKHGDAVQYHQNYPVPAAQSLQIALDAARGLQYLHEKRPPIIHLGLCTNDVLIDDSRQGVLGGFGLIEEASGSPPPNHPGFSSEFYRFLAPEHVNGTPARKTSADVWSWGMVALHLVGEKAPFCDSSDFQAGRFASDGARPKRERYPRVEEIPNSDTFWQLLEECWTRDEAKRPTMDDVVFRMKQLSALDNIPKPLPTVMDQPLPDGTTELGRRTSPILSGSPELQDNASQNAQRLAALIMNATNKKPDPSIMLGRGFVGQWKLLRSTAHYDLFTSKYVTEETVVIKALRDKIDGRDRNSQLPRFQKTAELWASLRSDYTLPFHGIGMSEQNGQIQIYSVSPFLPNGDAAKYHQNRFVPPAQSLQIVLDAAQGLNYLHNKRPAIVHFGVRTDDILITDDGRGVLAGFGLMKEADDISIATQTGMASDSYRFLPPEHLAGTSFPHKTSADVWAWAMIALHLVGGNKPYYDSTDLQAAMLISNGQRPMREKYPRLRDITDPDAFWELLNDCWAVDEARRPDMDNIVDRMKQLVGKPSEVLRPIAIRPGDGATMDEEPVDGRSQPPTAQGRDPRRGQH
ncbi:hypothetical protein FRC07_003161 [Ceratobasidium sp. 392]|nr:hypothetical protein FRC07_003161 [Ceratobasidium sp. 392]